LVEQQAIGGNPKPFFKRWTRIKAAYVSITTGKRPNYLILSGKELDSRANIVLSERSGLPELLFWIPNFPLLIEEFLNELPDDWQPKIVGLREQIRKTGSGITLCLNVAADPTAPLIKLLKAWEKFCEANSEYQRVQFALDQKRLRNPANEEDENKKRVREHYGEQV